MEEKKGRRRFDPQMDVQLAKLYARSLGEADFAAIEKIVELCAPEVFKVAFSVVREKELARDAVQEVFREFVRNHGKIAKESIRAWLRRVAHRKALRQRERQRKFPLPLEFIEDITDPGKTPLEDLFDKEAGEALVAAIQQLAKRERACMELYLKDIDPAHAAAMLGLSVSTYHTNLWRAKNRLRKIMKHRP